MKDNSRDLLDRASRGDDLAIEELLERHLDGLREYLKREIGAAVKARETPEDLVQSVCREILRNVDRFQYNGEDGFRQWLFTSALRKLKDKHRYYLRERRDLRREVPIQGQGSSSDPRLIQLFATICSPSQDAVRKEELAAAQAAFEELPERYQDVIVLAYVEQKNGAEIAEALDVTEVNARRILSRARARLAKLAAERMKKP